MPKKGEYVQFKNYERKITSPFMIYADFESILAPEDDEKQNPDESYMKKYQQHVAFSYSYQLVCVEDKFIQPFKAYLLEDAVYDCINSIIEESKYWSDVMKKHVNKELVITKGDNENFENSTKCWICDVYVDDVVKKKTMKILRTLLNIGSVIMLMMI